MDDILVFSLAFGSKKASNILGVSEYDIPFMLSGDLPINSFLRECLKSLSKMSSKEKMCDNLGISSCSYTKLMENLIGGPVEDLTCAFCGIVFPDRKQFKDHQKSHRLNRKVKCPECNKLVHKTYIKAHIQVHNNIKPYKCDFCPHRCTQYCNIKVHMRTCSFNPNKHKNHF